MIKYSHKTYCFNTNYLEVNMSHRIFDGMEMNGHEADTSKLKETGKVYFGDEAWDASDLITEEDKMEIFNEDMLRSKEDLLDMINYLLKRIEENSKKNTKHSPEYFARYSNLVERFKKQVEKSVFPEKLEDLWRYEYDIRETGITLTLEHAQSFDLSDEGYIDFVMNDTTFELIHIKSELLTVEQYAQAYGVTTTAVRQWIRRGKIRTAIKQGNEWRIPELAEVSDRGYKCIQYRWDEYLTGFPEEYSFINDYSLISIEQDAEHKEMFDVIFSGEVSEEKHVRMNKAEKEKFELLLISNPFISPVQSDLKAWE